MYTAVGHQYKCIAHWVWWKLTKSSVMSLISGLMKSYLHWLESALGVYYLAGSTLVYARVHRGLQICHHGMNHCTTGKQCGQRPGASVAKHSGIWRNHIMLASVMGPSVLYHFIQFTGHGSQASWNRRNVTVVTGHRGLAAKIQNKWSHQRNFAIFKL